MRRDGLKATPDEDGSITWVAFPVKQGIADVKYLSTAVFIPWFAMFFCVSYEGLFGKKVATVVALQPREFPKSSFKTLGMTG